ncbi:MAG: Eco57I restriction-modification methylase domain-containing protein [Candidatus Gastranaerophilales bacterium]|nr:Eco57I restriction-modification methylase domain-containing protein [Candidatus Gastranaerophilales bacterium]
MLKIIDAILNSEYLKDSNSFNFPFTQNIISDEIHNTSKTLLFLDKENEKKYNRKEDGRFYTPEDVSNFILGNAILQKASKKFNIKYAPKNLEHLLNIVYKSSYKEIVLDDIIDYKIFDPTCGTGAFLVNALYIKCLFVKKINTIVTLDDMMRIIRNLYGNDIDKNAIDIAMAKIILKSMELFGNSLNIRELQDVLKNNFTCNDFVCEQNCNNMKFDIIVGNPPYVESVKYKGKLNKDYGNIYANVIENSIKKLSADGVLGMIIPLSYTATVRMKGIRKYIEENMEQQFLLHYADRPDCLFDGVHQKLTIILANKGNGKHEVFTSGYKFWYKKEREILFNNIKTINNPFIRECFYPKLSNKMDLSIYRKVLTLSKNNFINTVSKNITSKSLFLNMRGTFWIKTSSNKISNEFKSFSYENSMIPVYHCILNSSLFFWFWTIVSDCWHITAKELSLFSLPVSLSKQEKKKFSVLYKKLSENLEKTKIRIDSKQSEFEYKHKYSKEIIDTIDDTLSQIYLLTSEELLYIKKYNEIYRMSLGVKNECH